MTGKSNEKLIILLVLDDLLLSQGFFKLLEEVPFLKPFKSTGHLKAVLDIFSRDIPDIVIIDLNLVNTSCIKLLKIMKYRQPETRFIILGETTNDHSIYKSKLAGAFAYVSKDQGYLDITKTIVEVYEVGNCLKNIPLDFVTEPIFKNHISTLTLKQIEIFNFLNTGMSIKKIAVELKLSSNTIKSHIKKMYKRSNVHNRQELIEYFKSE